MVSRLPGGSDVGPSLAEALRGEIQSRVSPRDFDTWFRPVQIDFLPPGRFVLGASNRFTRTWLEKKYLDLIRASAREVLVGRGAVPEVEIVTGRPPVKLNGENRPESQPLPLKSRPEAAEDSRGLPAPRPGAAGRLETVSQRLPAGIGPPESLEGGGPAEGNAPAEGAAPVESWPGSALSDHFTFANFVVGPSNRFVQAAAVNVAEAPVPSYNPVFIHGLVGLGKTHLLQAIAHRAQEIGRLRVRYFTSDAFIEAMERASAEGCLKQLRQALRETDILLVDDVQLIAAKDHMQEHFFHVFNTLISQSHQIVLTSDCAPNDIPHLKDRLISRFKMGLVTQIKPPSLETRVSILVRKARARGRSLPQEVADLLARHVASNVRELEGVLARLFTLADAEGDGVPLTVELARTALQQIGHEENRAGAVRLADVLRHVALYYNVKADEILSKSRSRSICLARHVGMYLARKLTTSSLKEIGAFFGNRDHATVSHAVKKKIEDLLSSEPKIRSDVEHIESRIQAERAIH